MFQSVSGLNSEQSIAHYSSRPTVLHQPQRTYISTVANAPFIQNSNQMASRVDRNRTFNSRAQYSRQHPSFSAHKAAQMTKTDLIFPTFSLRFVDFVVLFCFCCRFLFHEQPFWVKFDRGVIFLDQSKFLAMHSNQWDCLILYRQQITLNGFFRVRQSCQMPAFEYYYY